VRKGLLFAKHSDLPIALYGRETRKPSQSATKMIGSFERKILGRIFGAVEFTGIWKMRYSEVLNRLQRLAW
jgi:hypothetical protein